MKPLPVLPIDIESVGLHPYGGIIWMISYIAPTGSKAVQLIHDCNGVKRIPAQLKKWLEDPTIIKIIHSSEFDVPYICMQLGVMITNIWDTRLCEVVIQGVQIPRGSRDEDLSRQYSSSLKYTLPRYGFPQLNKEVRAAFINRPKGQPFTKEEKDYACNDVKYLPALMKAQEFLLKRDGLWEVALLENKTAEVIAGMRVRGIGFDVKVWKDNARKNLAEYNRLTAQLPKAVKNWGSPKQVKDYFKSKGIYIQSYTDLEEVQRSYNNKELGLFITMRNIYSDATTYGEGWLTIEGSKITPSRPTVDPDGRIRCSWEQILNTGRFATSNPNLLAIPKQGFQRAAFVPKKGHSFVIGDFSGQEIGVMAAGGDESIWIEAGLRGDDIHSLTASMLYASEWQHHKEKRCSFPLKCSCEGHIPLRDSAKILNFMLAYGGGPQKFSQSTGVTMQEAKQIIKRYKRVIPRLSKWLERNGQDALNTGVSFSADPYRRRRVLMGEEDWQVVNQGKNNPVQSAGANMLKLAMISMPNEYPIVLVIHDEIVLEVPDGKAAKALKALKSVMEQSADYITGIAGLIKVEPRISKSLAKPKK